MSCGRGYGDQAEYRCLDGYELTSGPTVVTCEEDGSWNASAPTCSPVVCDPPEPPANGTVDLSNGTQYMATAVYSCNIGFELIGASNVTCQTNKSWTNSSPSCLMVDCGQPPDISEYGFVDFPNGTYFGDIAIYWCDTGYQLLGQNTSTCQENKTWSSGPPICTPVNCSSPPEANEYGYIEVASGTTYLSNVTYRCELGYRLSGTEVLLCQSDGEWSTEAPTCEPVDCGEPGSDSIMAFTTPDGTGFQDIAIYSCPLGTNLSGNDTRECLSDGTWSGTLPSCNPIDCMTLPDPEFGKVNVSGGTQYGNTAKYECNIGYLVNGSSARICQANGEWSGLEPRCIDVDCGNPSVSVFGSVSTPNGTSYRAKSYYNCSLGYYLSGPRERTCQYDGSWSDQEPDCEIVDCGEPNVPTKGSVQIPNGTTFGKRTFFNCDEGFHITGSNESVCLFDSSWSNNNQTCDVLNCGNLSAPLNGHVYTRSGTTYGEVAVFECDVGFSVNGTSTIYCDNTGLWSSAPPLCTVAGVYYLTLLGFTFSHFLL